MNRFIFKNSTFEEMINKCMLNEILYHVGMLWIIRSSNEIKYEIDKSNHRYWLDKGPWYNIDIYSRLHGSLLEYFITHARTDINNFMFYLISHDKIQPAYEDDERSIGYKLIRKR